MLYRHIAVALLAIALATPMAAQQRGHVYLENLAHAPNFGGKQTYDFWIHVGWRHTYVAGATLLIYKGAPLSGPGHLLVPSPCDYYFHDLHTVSWWNGIPIPASQPGNAYIDIFRSEAELGEIAPGRGGNYLVPQLSTARGETPKLIEFNTRGVVAEHPFPEVVDLPNRRALGAKHVELLADQCTVLYTLGEAQHPTSHLVRRMNICTGAAQSDFAALVPGEYAGSIRQLASGDVLVANGSAVLQFDAAGNVRRTWQSPGVRRIALTPEGDAFWAAGVQLERGYLHRHDLGRPGAAPASIALGNPEMQSIYVPLETTDLVTVGEWRAATSNAPKKRSRATRH